MSSKSEDCLSAGAELITERVHRHRTTIEDILRITRCPVVSYGILYNNEVADMQSFGLANISQGTQVNSKTVFGISSLTNAFTATACALLELDGVLDWGENGC